MISCVEYLENTVRRSPEKTAIVDGGNRFTFQDLHRAAISIANAIPDLPASSPVAVYLPKSFDAISAFLGVLYSRNFYAPVDVKIPIERAEKILQDLTPRVIISSEKFAEKVKPLAKAVGADVVLIEDACRHPVEASSKGNHHRWKEAADTDPIYCIYTSGSTGDPKGVLVSHRSVADFIDWVETSFGIDESYILGNQSPLVFDVSVLDIYSMLKCGCELHLIPEMLFSFPAKLLDYVSENSLNFIIWVPSVLISVANAGVFESRNLEGLDYVLFAGEVMPCKQLNQWRQAVPSASFGNLYGPTEATVIATYYMVDRDFDDEESLPIGKACRNVEAVILDGLEPVNDQGKIGELCLRGTSLAMGYWRDEKKTNEVFIQNPSHNDYVDLLYRTGDLVHWDQNRDLIYVGRKDSQIKHMGYRIELGDIENVLGGFAGLKHWCVVYHQEASEIVLFYVGETTAIDQKEMRKFLSKKLPRYMTPGRFVEMQELPINQNGKIDRRKLGEIVASCGDEKL